MWLTATLLGIVITGWVALFGYWAWGTGGTITPGAHAATPPRPEPLVSIVVAARNERTRLEGFLSSVLSLDYPSYEVVLVDDGSTDGTGDLAESWASRPEAAGKLRVLHTEGPPPGWTGKPHALHLAEQHCHGEWLLVCDADTLLAPAALRFALGRAAQTESQLVSLVPSVTLPSFWARAIAPAFGLFMVTLYPPRLVNDPRSRLAGASGAFMLMRREDLQAVGGFAVARAAVLEDRRIAEAFKHSGRRLHVTSSAGLVRTAFHARLGEIGEGLGRCVFEGAGYSTFKILLGIAASFLMVVWPWLVLVSTLAGPRGGIVGWLALAASGLGGMAYGFALRSLGVAWYYVPAFPWATLFYEGVALHAIYRGVRDGQTRWKGRVISVGPPRREKPDA